MALSILCENGKNVIHTAHHDLESLMYVFFNLCTGIDGPGNQLRILQGMSSIPLLEWFHDGWSYRRLGRVKQGQLADFEHSILKHFTAYWNPLKPLAERLFHATFPNGVIGHAPQPQITHKKMVEILTWAIERLVESDDGFMSPQILIQPSKKSSSRPPPQQNRPAYPIKKRSASRAEVVSEEGSVPPEKKSRTGQSRVRSQGLTASPYVSVDSPISTDSMPANIIRKPPRHRSSGVSDATASSSRATPELGARGRDTIRKYEALAKLASSSSYAPHKGSRRGSTG